MFVSCARQDKTTVPALKVQGTALYQEGGEQPVVWRGLSFGWHNIWPRFYNKEAVNVLVNEWGCPVFRAAIGADDLEETCPLGGYRSDAALAAGLPVFISECAACEASGDGPIDPEEWAKWNEWAADRGVSLLTWSISDKNETCSMFTPEASSEGPWDDAVIKEWGKISRDWLKK